MYLKFVSHSYQRVIPIDMNDRSADHFRHVGAVMRRPPVVLSCCEPQLIIDDKMNRPPDVKVGQIGENHTLHDDPLSSERSVSMDLKVENFRRRCGVVRLWSPAVSAVSKGELPRTGFPQSDWIDGLEVGGVW